MSISLTHFLNQNIFLSFFDRWKLMRHKKWNDKIIVLARHVSFSGVLCAFNESNSKVSSTNVQIVFTIKLSRWIFRRKKMHSPLAQQHKMLEDVPIQFFWFFSVAEKKNLQSSPLSTYIILILFRHSNLTLRFKRWWSWSHRIDN